MFETAASDLLSNAVLFTHTDFGSTFHRAHSEMDKGVIIGC